MKFVVSPGDSFDESFYLTDYKRSREGIIVDAELPSEVEKAVSLVSDYFNMGELPVASLDFGGHGPAGLIFTERKGLTRGEDMNTDFDIYGIMARISFGPSHKENKKIKKAGWLPSNIDRLHISVHGGREFFSIDYEKLERDSWRVTPELAKFKEQVHFSWRYKDGKFDDWNNLDEWLADKDSQMLEHKRFKQFRTTHLDSEVYFDNTDKTDCLRDHLNYFGRKDNAFPLNVPFDVYAEANSGKYSPQDLVKMLGKHHDKGNVPIIGYAPAITLLSKYGDVSPKDANNLSGFTPMQAVEYVFGKVLPAVDKFVIS